MARATANAVQKAVGFINNIVVTDVDGNERKLKSDQICISIKDLELAKAMEGCTISLKGVGSIYDPNTSKEEAPLRFK